MIKLLGEWWIQIWPNLAGQVMWVTPLFIWHHRKLKSHIEGLLK